MPTVLVTGPTVTQNQSINQSINYLFVEKNSPELAVSSLGIAVAFTTTDFAYPRRDDQAELAWVSWLNTRERSLIQVLARLDV